MRQITIRQLVRQGNEAKIREWMPCEITADGVVIAALVPVCDVRQTSKVDVRQANKARRDVNKLPLNSKASRDIRKPLYPLSEDVRKANKLKFSKESQARGRMRG